MKFKISLLFFFLAIAAFSQNEVFFLKDTSDAFTIETIQNANFHPVENQILEKYSNTTFWFKVPAQQTEQDYIFRIIYERIHNADVYQGEKKLKKIANQRFLSYQFSRNKDVYVKINPKLHSYIPFELNSVTKSSEKENNYLLLNGFYYGFAFLVIIYNLCYSFLFKDNTFFYYALFLSTTTFGVFTMDGMLNFYNISRGLNDVIMVLNYIFLAFFASKFINAYLFLDNYYPRVKRFSYVLGIAAILFGLLYLINNDFYFLLALGVVVFSLLLIYWVCAVTLFHKNVYIKIMVFAYPIILISGIDYYIIKFLGISFINIDALNIKIGAFLEMIILSIAVLYRMQSLKLENDLMRTEIIDYSKQVNELTTNNGNEKAKSSLEALSYREREIFDLIILGKSNKEIADNLSISVNTVKFHIKNIYDKLSIKSRKEALNLGVITQ